MTQLLPSRAMNRVMSRVTPMLPGVGAMLNYTRNRVYVFDWVGQYYSLYSQETGTWTQVHPLTDWGASLGPAWNIPFLGEGVGAALQVYAENFFPDPATGQIAPGKDYFQVLFNDDGSEVAIYHGKYGFTPKYEIVRKVEGS